MPKKTNQGQVATGAALYNMIPNLIWSILFIGPVFWYCYQYLLANVWIKMLVFSFLPLFFPRSWLNATELGRGESFYRRIGVSQVAKWTQNGYWVNRWLQKKNPQFRVMATSRISARRQYDKTYFFERFHAAFLVFDLLLLANAAYNGRTGWAITILVCNLFYNLYPILIQHYIRTRLRSVIRTN